MKLEKTAFLCSQRCPAGIVLKSYDWAKRQREDGSCIVCGNHSQIEKDVFSILMKGKQPVILMLARGMKSRWDPGIDQAIADGRLLVLSPFEQGIKRVTRATAKVRNSLLVEMSDQIMVAYASLGGQLNQLLTGQRC